MGSCVVCDLWWIPSEVVFEIAGNRRSRKRPQNDLMHNGSPETPKRRTQDFHGRALGNPVWDPRRRSRAMSIFPLETNENERVGSLRFSLWKPSPFLVLLLWHQPTASEFNCPRPGSREFSIYKMAFPVSGSSICLFYSRVAEAQSYINFCQP